MTFATQLLLDSSISPFFRSVLTSFSMNSVSFLLYLIGFSKLGSLLCNSILKGSTFASVSSSLLIARFSIYNERL